jgi:uncharacterized protein YqeY
MSLKSQLENDVKEAMRARDERRKSALRMALSAIKLAEVDKGASLDDAGVTAVLQKEIKARRESIADAERAGRPAMAAEAAADIALLEGYLPKQLTPDELEDLARQVIAEVGAASAREMGQVMKVLLPRVAGRASGAEVNQVVRKLLQ